MKARKKSKKKKLYQKKKAYYTKDKFFVVLVILILLFLINNIFLYRNALLKKQEKRKVAQEQEQLIQKREQVKNLRKGDIVFLGDSITEMYDLEKYYSYPIINSGVSGWTTDDILSHLEEKVFQYHPKILVLLIGTNDINNGKDSTYIASNIEKIVDRIIEEESKVEIYIESIYPINNTDQEKIDHQLVGKRTNEVIRDINKKVKKCCKLKGLNYIDMYSLLLDERGELNLIYTKEGLHINEEGYQVITKRLKKSIEI